jgi:hypothetical protein
LTWTWHALQAWLLKKETEENKNGLLLIGFFVKSKYSDSEERQNGRRR